MLHDNDLRIGWGKAIPIPAAPMFVLNPPGGAALARGAAIAPPGTAAASAPWGVTGAQQPASTGNISPSDLTARLQHVAMVAWSVAYAAPLAEAWE